MKTIKKIFIGIGVALGLMIPMVAIAQVLSVFRPIQGGTGTSSIPSTGQVLVGQANGTYGPQATSTLGISSSGVTSLTAGTNISVTANTGAITISSTGGSGTPSGSSSTVQYNSNGSFAGSSNLTFDGTILKSSYFSGDGTQIFNTPLYNSLQQKWSMVASTTGQSNQVYSSAYVLYPETASTTATDHYSVTQPSTFTDSTGKIIVYATTINTLGTDETIGCYSGYSLINLTRCDTYMPALTKSSSGWDGGYVSGPRIYGPDLLCGTGNSPGYCLYYFGGPTTGFESVPAETGVATSSSPYGPWVKYINNPIVSTSTNPLAWDAKSIDRMYVIKSGMVYYMFFNALNNVDATESTGFATSSSPLGPWNKYSTNPILSPSKNGTDWDEKFNSDPVIFRSYNGQWGMIYTGVNTGTGYGAARLGLAYSTDLVHWTKSPTNPMSVPGSLTSVGTGAQVRPDLIQINGQMYLLFDDQIGIQAAQSVSSTQQATNGFIVRDSNPQSLTSMSIENDGGGSGGQTGINFFTAQPVYTSGIPMAQINALDDNNYSDSIRFLNKIPGAATNALQENMRLTDTGNLGLATTSPGSLFSIGNTNGINLSTATSSFSSTGGINIKNGCFAISSVCISGSGGSGTVTSVGMTVPTGLSISGSPITNSGTLGLTFAAGYNIPLTSSTTQWNNIYNASTTFTYLTNSGVNTILNTGSNLQAGTFTSTSTGQSTIAGSINIQGGTSGSPKDNLSLYGNTNAGLLSIQNGSASGWSAVDSFDSGGNQVGGFGYGNASVSNFPNEMYMFSFSGKDIVIQPGSSGSFSQGIMLKSSGKVGISESTPLSALDVNGGISIGSYAGNSAAPANSLIVSGNGGFGTTTPGTGIVSQTGIQAYGAAPDVGTGGNTAIACYTTAGVLGHITITSVLSSGNCVAN